MRKPGILTAAALIIALTGAIRLGGIAWDGAALVGLARAETDSTTEPSATTTEKSAKTDTPTPASGAQDNTTRRADCPSPDPHLLAVIAAERADLAERERRLAEREAIALAAETRARIEIERLIEIRDGLENLVAERARMEDQDLRRMAKMYSNMKPKDAARILAGLDDLSVVGIIDHMSERESAPILAALPSDKAEAVARTIIERRSLPEDRPSEQSPR